MIDSNTFVACQALGLNTHMHTMYQQGGISNGEDIICRVAFKPTSTISKEQKTVTRDGQETTLSVHGRHDPCVLPRAVPIVEAMVALTLLDALIGHHGQCELFPRDFKFGEGSSYYSANTAPQKV